MPLEYFKTAAITKAQGIKCALYAGAGVGKTASICTAPRPFLVAIEPGLISLTPQNIVRMFGANTPGICYDVDGVKIQRIPGASPLPQVREIHAAFYRQDPWTLQFDTLGFDTISELAEWELAFQMTQTPNGQKAYGQMADEILGLIRDFTALPRINEIFFAKQGVSSHSGLFSASFPGQLLDFHFPHEFDVVLQGCLADAEGVISRYFRTQSDYKNFAKDRTGALDPKGEHAYFYNIFNKIAQG